MSNLNNMFNSPKEKRRIDQMYGIKKKEYNKQDYKIDESGYEYVGIKDGYQLFIKMVPGQLPENKQLIPAIYKIDKEAKKTYIEITVKVDLKNARSKIIKALELDNNEKDDKEEKERERE